MAVRTEYAKVVGQLIWAIFRDMNFFSHPYVVHDFFWWVKACTITFFMPKNRT